ncbi:MAG: nucleoside deaminase [Gammaproteobacteria bacterium]|nr:nucleoside deaminase [Gammaproteobacteria bacterium]MCP4090693.1 nucleoside deaminase [Gammaproteobacteria bacterium]MCP4277120.1 nucleoside deaminase [Gammaproteobacteria bacterium]MCP4832676.1 nucleoside deaminase [Gammaproteobacteria bacterium]MCP4928070.1 nucleoside deaminase [Gammaproteobacteria bacterium]
MGVAADSASASRERFMRIALKMAERGMAAGGPPVGACLVRAGEVIVAAHNSVISELDITAHAEISVIRQACQELRVLTLEECSLYVTVEPCLMCLSACFYAGIQEIVFAAPISAMQTFTNSELSLDIGELYPGTITGGVLEADCLALLARWQPLTGGKC